MADLAVETYRDCIGSKGQCGRRCSSVELEMSRFRLFCIALLLLTSNALCQDTRYDFDRTTDFSKFRTYRWVSLKSEAPIDELTDEQIKAALDAALARKGLAKIDGDSAADLLIGYQTTEQIKQDFVGDPGWSSGSGWRVTGSGANEAWR